MLVEGVSHDRRTKAPKAAYCRLKGRAIAAHSKWGGDRLLPEGITILGWVTEFVQVPRKGCCLSPGAGSAGGWAILFDRERSHLSTIIWALHRHESGPVVYRVWAGENRDAAWN